MVTVVDVSVYCFLPPSLLPMLLMYHITTLHLTSLHYTTLHTTSLHTTLKYTLKYTLQLEGPLNVKHINMKKLGDLKAVREEFKRIKAIMSARAQALENAKKSALPAIDALQELVTCVERASVCMSDALAPSTISSESSSGDKKTCGHLNFVQLQGDASAVHVNSLCHSLCHSLACCYHRLLNSDV